MAKTYSVRPCRVVPYRSWVKIPGSTLCYPLHRIDEQSLVSGVAVSLVIVAGRDADEVGRTAGTVMNDDATTTMSR